MRENRVKSEDEIGILLRLLTVSESGEMMVGKGHCSYFASFGV
jgi:hypothetical protein